jgi:hypothetical protein
MTMQNISTLCELDFDQLDDVGGGSEQWSISTATVVALTVGAATVTSPLIAGTLAAGGIISAGFAIYYAVDTWK